MSNVRGRNVREEERKERSDAKARKEKWKENQEKGRNKKKEKRGEGHEAKIEGSRIKGNYMRNQKNKVGLKWLMIKW